MSELKKKRMRYEILEDIESWLNSRIKSLEENIDYNSSEDCKGPDGLLPEWRVESNRDDEMKIAECRDIAKALLKL